jgi:opacity protein-like surface antigen
MKRCIFLLRATLMLTLIQFPLLSHAEEQGLSNLLGAPIDRDYAAIGLAFNEFRSVELVLEEQNGEVADSFFPLTAQTYATSFTLGTYITENFKTELRAGTGIRDDTLKKALDININYWFNWYIGPTYPITDYMSGYALIGLSHYDADVTRREINYTIPRSGTTQPRPTKVSPSTTRMEEGLFGTSFSTSWLLGLDFHLVDTWYLALEYGRLLKDTDSNIKVYQAGTYLRYEF